MFYIRVGVGVMDRGKVPVVLQHKGEGRSFYVFPGGHLEGEESFEQAGVREIKEELGLEVGGLELLGYGLMERKGAFTLDLMMTAVLEGGQEERQLEEIDEIRWVGADELEGLDVRPALMKEAMVGVLKGKKPEGPASLGYFEV